jgi:hypothetical protein
MEEDKRDVRETKVSFMSRGMLCVLDLGFPNDKLNERASKTKWFLRKRILDGLHQIENENKEMNENSMKEV